MTQNPINALKITTYNTKHTNNTKHIPTIPSFQKIKTFQIDGAREAGIFHHLITLPTYHTAALNMNNLTEGYFGDEGMLAYVKGVQRQEIRKGVSCVKHQRMAGSDLGDDHKTFFAGEKALKAGGEKNTSNQFEIDAKTDKLKENLSVVA